MFEGHNLRVTGTPDEPWFVAKDVCDAIGVGNSRQALSYLDDDEKGVISNDTPGGTQDLSTINESGLYSLVLRSRKQEAKVFKKWITSEVLPSIRKRGSYGVTQQPMTREQRLQIGLEASQELVKALEAKNSSLELKVDIDSPKVGFYEHFANKDDQDLILTDAAAALRLLDTQGRVMGRNKLRDFLIEKKYLYYQGRKLRAYKEWVEKGYFKNKVKDFTNPNSGEMQLTWQLHFTPKGIAYLKQEFGKTSAR